MRLGVMADQEADDRRDRPKLPAAKWGAACSACATAKAKCIRSDPDSNAKCDRCRRLLKECTGQIHRPRKKRQAKPSRTAQIEERLNGLVNLLQASGELPSNHSPLTTLSDAAARERSVSTRDTPSAASSMKSSYMPHPEEWIIPETYNCHTISSCLCRPVPGTAPPPPDFDEVLLELFRSRMQPLFPFVIIPASVSATELGGSKPFLMSAIRMVSSTRSFRSMRAQMYRLMSHLSEYVLVRSARSLELLQGILVMIAWCQHHCMMHSHLNNLLALAASMVGDMGYNSPPCVREQARLMVAKPPEPSGRTNEERRALLGVWFLTCNVAVSFNRIESMRYTSYIQECIKFLEHEKEFESDVTLIYLVKVQRLTERIFELTSKDKIEEDIAGIPSAPMSAYVASLQHEIDNVEASLPSHLRDDNVFMTYLHTAKVRLHEPLPVDLNLVKSLTESMTVGPFGRGTPLDKLYQSSAALRNWFDNWLQMPVASCVWQPLSVVCQLVYSLTMLGRWAQLATPRTMYEGGTPMPHGKESSMYTSDPQLATNGLPESRPSARPCQGEYSSPCNDTHLIQAVAALQSQLQSQPGLTINIPEILATLCSRYEHINNDFEQTAPEEQKFHNLWAFSALKVRITRVKLERWAELVAAAAKGPSRVAKDEHTPHSRGLYPQAADANMGQAAGDVVPSGLAQDETQIQNFFDSTPWTSDPLYGVDSTIYLDGYLDWGSLFMNSAGNPLGTVAVPQT